MANNFLKNVKDKIPQNDKKPKKPKQKQRRLDIWNKIAVGILTLFLVGCISVFFVLVNIINDPEGMRFSQDGLQTSMNLYKRFVMMSNTKIFLNVLSMLSYPLKTPVSLVITDSICHVSYPLPLPTCEAVVSNKVVPL